MGTNTGIGIGIGIPFKNNVLGEGKPYLPPEIKDSLKAVVIAYGKTNNDSDRAIVKNLVDASNPFVISNAAFKLNSGFGKYEVDFTTWSKVAGTSIITDSKYVLTDEKAITNGGYFLWNRLAKDSFKVKISNIPNGGWMSYRYRITEEDTQLSSLFIREDGIYTLPATVAGSDVDFFISTASAPAKDWVGLTITQIPSFEGAFVTDGIDDLITSTKTLQEMLGGSNEITVVSMIHQIGLIPSQSYARNNYFIQGNDFLTNTISAIGKIGIYGYKGNLSNIAIVNDILGDKKDYSVDKANPANIDSVFSVNGTHSSAQLSSVAWYWTIIANKVLTTDQINQVIAYFNLDRTLNPDILCNTIKQGITNDNHAEFGDKLIDFSGNGRDIQLNNIAWDGDSGIGKYNYPNWKVNVTRGNKYARIVYYDSINGTYSADFKGITDLYKSYGLSVEIRVNRANTIDYHSIKEDGIYTVTPPDDTTSIDIRFGGENVYNASCDITITQIPSHAGALCLDGVNDFGKVTGMPVYKDYTFIIDRQIISIGDTAGVVASKSEDSADATKHGAFIFEYLAAPDKISTWSFYKDNGQVANTDFTRGISYQSTYSYNGKDLTIGTSKDSDKLWLGTIRDNDSRFFNGAIYSLMSFPYSMSEFLIERQLKKHKLGTLYPNMVEFRPVIKHDDRITAIKYYHIKGSSWINLKPGDYIPVGSKISITTNLKSPYTIANVVSSSLTDIKVVPSAGGGNAYDILGYVTDKSPQKINLTIEQDEKYVLFNPIIKSNVEYHKLDFYLNNFEKRINIGDYIPKDAYLRANLYLKNNVDELTVFTFNGVNIDYRRSIVDDTAFNIGHIYNYDSPQEVNITIDEYIRYEDIKQPYPLLFGFTDENGNLIS